MNITEKLLQTIKTYFLDLAEIVYMYKTYFNEESWEISLFPSSVAKLKKLNILTDDLRLTANGEEILFECIEEIKPTTSDVSKFDEIWLTFPKDDSNRQFMSTRVIRYNKPATKAEYEIALKKYTHEQLLAALKNELEYRRGNSTDNRLKYMKSSVNWFKTKAYEEYIDIEDNSNTEEAYGKKII